MRRRVASLEEERRQNSSYLVWGPLIIGLGLGFQKTRGKCFVMKVPMYFDVSHNIEILHLNDSNEFENKIHKQLEKKIEPMESILETINLGNDENPHLIKIGSTINEKERKDLQELLEEFQEVFAWSYEDMPRIDPEIAQHHIYTHDHIVPFK